MLPVLKGISWSCAGFNWAAPDHGRMSLLHTPYGRYPTTRKGWSVSQVCRSRLSNITGCVEVTPIRKGGWDPAVLSLRQLMETKNRWGLCWHTWDLDMENSNPSEPRAASPPSVQILKNKKGKTIKCHLNLVLNQWQQLPKSALQRLLSPSDSSREHNASFNKRLIWSAAYPPQGYSVCDISVFASILSNIASCFSSLSAHQGRHRKEIQLWIVNKDLTCKLFTLMKVHVLPWLPHFRHNKHS